ncbi:MAG: hypothetical protein IH944_08985 [Armatimonadetes bacterium]|nr:hypothetical protein [Armatimonadota bacterium]
MKRTSRRHGSTLIETLTVIVVFLVGILAMIQIFPPGLTALRHTGGVQAAAAIGRAEVQRMQAKPGQLPEYIAPVTYVTTNAGSFIILDPNRPFSELMADKDPDPAPGFLDQNGDIFLNGGVDNIGSWEKISGSNRFSRVFGESHPVTSPRQVGSSLYGSIIDMMFAPFYFFPTPNGVGEPGVLQAYGNRFSRRTGNRLRGIPSTFRTPSSTRFYFVPASLTDSGDPFPGFDQIWVSGLSVIDLRFQLSFFYDSGGNTDEYSTIITVLLDPAALPPFAGMAGNYIVISVPELIGQVDIYGRNLYAPGNYLGVDANSLRVQRLFSEIPVANAFNPSNPYEYKVVSSNLGSILVNPRAFQFKVRNERGQLKPLQVNLDYTVFDWRILRDEFRAPRGAPYSLKLLRPSIKSLTSPGPDGRQHTGIGLAVPVLDPSGASVTVRDDDFVVVDLTTGAVVLGNHTSTGANESGYYVDKTNGFITFRDVDGIVDPSTGNGLSAYMSFPTNDPLFPWSAPVFVADIGGRALRALYLARGEWAVQPYKAASEYRITGLLASNGLQIAECYIGASRLDAGNVPIGDPDRLYFPLADRGHKVLVGEIWYNQGFGPRVFRDQEFQIDGIQNVGGTQLAYADLSARAPGAVFDYSRGYAVRRVRGASMTVRVLWNPASFVLGTDPEANFRRLEVWMRSWRRMKTDSFAVGGAK